MVAEYTTPCIYRLDDDTSSTIMLPDGRELGYAEYGSKTGKPVFFLHGLPGSRIEASMLDPIAMDCDARIIAVDRPGYGWSSPQPDRKLLDHPKDLIYLAEHLKLERYGVLGISGGGPYTLACAAAMPTDKLKGIACMCGPGTPDMPKTGMNWFHWLGFSVGWRYLPRLCEWFFGREPAANLQIPDDKRFNMIRDAWSKSITHPKDRWLFEDSNYLHMYVRNSRQFYGQGLAGMCQDGRLLCMDFGFRLEDIRKDLPVYLWYGQEDTHVPPVYGEHIAMRIGANATLHMQDETHASLFRNCRAQALRELVSVI